MKSILFLSIVLFASIITYAQPNHPNSPHDTVTAKNIKVTYGRPYKKGRDIFGALEPYGKVYRCGADEATEITFSKDGTLNGAPVKAGTYTLCAIPNQKEWTIILNSQLKQWGAFSYDKYKDKDVLHTNVPVKNLSNVVDQFTIRFAGKDMIIEWDKTQIVIPANFG